MRNDISQYNKHYCVFGGTTEGRLLAISLVKAGYKVTLSVATDVGEKAIPKCEGITIQNGRMDLDAMSSFLLEGKFDAIIDATHPYAVVVSENIRSATKALDIKYYRLLRSQSDYGNATVVSSTEEAVEYLSTTSGQILLTTGAKELVAYTKIPDFSSRCCPRVLPMIESITACHELGFHSSKIIAMQGPFSKELTREMLLSQNIAIMVTKDSGREGGFAEKVAAARELGIDIVVIARPSETDGLSLEEIEKILGCESTNLVSADNSNEKKSITILGVGPGSKDLLTVAAYNAIKNADLLIGAKRLLEETTSDNKIADRFNSFKDSEIKSHLEENPKYKNIAILMSGDIGFYSGAKKLYAALEDYEVRTIPGINSLVYFASRLKISWDDSKFISLHGRDSDILSALKTSNKLFTLLGGDWDVTKLTKYLSENGYANATITVGENLSYQSERITIFRADSMPDIEFDKLSVALINI